MIPLTHEQIGERRLELATVEEAIRMLGRRKSVLRAEILSGFAAPAKGVAPEQLSLDTATIGELDRMLVRLDREGIGRRLLWLLDHGYVSRERGSGLWRRLDDAGEPPAAGEEVAS